MVAKHSFRTKKWNDTQPTGAADRPLVVVAVNCLYGNACIENKNRLFSPRWVAAGVAVGRCVAFVGRQRLGYGASGGTGRKSSFATSAPWCETNPIKISISFEKVSTKPPHHRYSGWLTCGPLLLRQELFFLTNVHCWWIRQSPPLLHNWVTLWWLAYKIIGITEKLVDLCTQFTTSKTNMLLKNYNIFT